MDIKVGVKLLEDLPRITRQCGTSEMMATVLEAISCYQHLVCYSRPLFCITVFPLDSKGPRHFRFGSDVDHVWTVRWVKCACLSNTVAQPFVSPQNSQEGAKSKQHQLAHFVLACGGSMCITLNYEYRPQDLPEVWQRTPVMSSGRCDMNELLELPLNKPPTCGKHLVRTPRRRETQTQNVYIVCAPPVCTSVDTFSFSIYIYIYTFHVCTSFLWDYRCAQVSYVCGMLAQAPFSWRLHTGPDKLL